MTPAEFETLLKTFGVPGLLVAAFFYLAVKTDVFKRDEPHRSDLLDEIKAVRHEVSTLRGESASENRAIRNEVSDIKNKLARFEVTQEIQSKQIDRIENRNTRRDREG